MANDDPPQNHYEKCLAQMNYERKFYAESEERVDRALKELDKENHFRWVVRKIILRHLTERRCYDVAIQEIEELYHKLQSRLSEDQEREPWLAKKIVEDEWTFKISEADGKLFVRWSTWGNIFVIAAFAAIAAFPEAFVVVIGVWYTAWMGFMHLTRRRVFKNWDTTNGAKWAAGDAAMDKKDKEIEDELIALDASRREILDWLEYHTAKYEGMLDMIDWASYEVVMRQET